MTKMAATSIYGKNPPKSSPEPAGRFQQNFVCSILVCSNDDPGVTLTYYTAMSKLVTSFSMRKGLKVVRYRQLIEFMKVCEY